MKAKIKLIVAMDEERGIGKNNDLMWHLPNDMKFFKEMTNGQIVIMGRKNYDSIPERFRPLPNRLNVVLSRNSDFDAPNCLVFNSLLESLNSFSEEKERDVYIIGGGQIYKEALDLDVVDEMYITHINHTFGADTFFPEFTESKWDISTISTQVQDEKHMCSFEIKKYSRK